MKQTKQVSARIGTEFIEEYIEKYKEYQKVFFPDTPPRDLTMTSILEESLFYAARYFDLTSERMKDSLKQSEEK